MKTILGALAGLSIAAAATPAAALTFYSGFGELYLELLEGTGPDIELTVAVSSSGDSTSSTSGTGNIASSVGFLSNGLGDFGVQGAISGSTDAPFGTAAQDLFLNLTFTLTNNGPIPAIDIGIQGEQVFEGDFIVDLSASASSTLTDEIANSFVAASVFDPSGEFVGGESVFADQEKLTDSTDGPVIIFSISGLLFPGESVTYEGFIDLIGEAETPRGTGPGAEVPLPAAGALMTLGLGALLAARRRRS